MIHRLTIHDRSAITNGLLNHRFDKEEAALKARDTALALAVYNDTYPAATQRKMSGLPKGWLIEMDRISVNFKGNRVHLHLPAPRRFLNKHEDTHTVVYTARAPRCEEWEALAGDRKKLREDRDALARQIQSTLAAFSNVKRLIEAWPEVRPYLSVLVARPLLPAIPTKTLNTALRLP
jgi:Nucleotide modification associated domain 5